MAFFTGTLQEGIQSALQQSKLVVCFVTDGESESQTWETEYLTDESIAPSLERDAVVLRLQAGSQEAGYLAAIFPLPKTPTVVIIKTGQLKEYVAAGTTKEEFLRRVGNAFAGQAGDQSQAGSAGTAQAGSPAPATPVSAPDTTAVVPSVQATSSSGEAAPASSAPNAPTPQPSEADRRREAARKEREEIEKERRRKEKGKMAAEESQPQDSDPRPKQPDTVKKASQKLAEQKAKAREERARVLKLIADDKAERKARDELRRQERELERRAAMGDNVSSPLPETSSTSAPASSAARKHDQCAIQVRLFDGSTIRTRFPSKATLSQDVRKWIDENRTDGKEPYTFKVILTPLPNRAVDHATEEEQSLEALELTPSATLVLTPVDRYSEAYTSMNAGLTNPASRLVTAVLTFVMNILSCIAGGLGGLGSSGSSGSGSGQEGAQQDLDQSQASATGRDAGGRIKGFQNPDDRPKDYQLYNGNSVRTSLCDVPWMERNANTGQLNFEPRKDEDDKDK